MGFPPFLFCNYFLRPRNIRKAPESKARAFPPAPRFTSGTEMQSQGKPKANPATPKKSNVTPIILLMQEMFTRNRQGVKYQGHGNGTSRLTCFLIVA